MENIFEKCATFVEIILVQHVKQQGNLAKAVPVFNGDIN
jgi:hypothetical protein